MASNRRSFLRTLGCASAGCIGVVAATGNRTATVLETDAERAIQSGQDGYERVVQADQHTTFEGIAETDDGLVAAGTVFDASEPRDPRHGGDILLARVDPGGGTIETVVVGVDEPIRVTDVSATDGGFVVAGSVDRDGEPASVLAYHFRTLGEVTYAVQFPGHGDLRAAPQFLRVFPMGDRLAFVWNLDVNSEQFALVVDVCDAAGERIARASYPGYQYGSVFLHDGQLRLTTYHYDRGVLRLGHLDPETATITAGAELPLAAIPPESHTAIAPTPSGFAGVWFDDGEWRTRFYDGSVTPRGDPITVDPGFEEGRTYLSRAATIGGDLVLSLFRAPPQGSGPWAMWLGRVSPGDGLQWGRQLAGDARSWLGLGLIVTGESYHLVGATRRFDAWVLGATEPPDHSLAAGSTSPTEAEKTVAIGERVESAITLTPVEKPLSSPQRTRTPQLTGALDGAATDGDTPPATGDGRHDGTTAETGDGPVWPIGAAALATGVGIGATRWLRARGNE